jgi:dihydrofolate reductase
MRRILFGGAMSLDGYIAGPNGEYDWIATDPDIDFAALMARHDTYLIGRKTYDAMRKMGGGGEVAPGSRSYVFSRTMAAGERDGLTFSQDAVSVAARLKAEPGKDIALFGGGELFRSLLAAGLVDGVEVSLVPVLLGGGIPLLPPPADRVTLKLRGQRVYKTTGTVGLEYDIVRK